MNSVNNIYENLELSTQMVIKEALYRNIKVEVLDRKDNFIRLSKGGKVEYIRQATRTSADSYIAPLIMENKFVTKLVLSEAGIRVPNGVVYDDIFEAISAYSEFKGKAIVVKPKSTNFGYGVAILGGDHSPDEYKLALDEAFTHDDTVIVEEFIEGKEYRFLVIDDEVIAVLHRVPANVIGNGKSSIHELINEKNTNPLRGTGYTKPLEKIQAGAMEQAFLKLQGKDLSYIPKMGEQIFLRKNSNISTGGDSIDYTDEVLDDYKEIAVNAARAAGAKICGADIIIKDIYAAPDEDNYSIIELNFNPALHIHGFPYDGKNRFPEKKILDLLGF